MRRRDFIALAGCAVAVPVGARAQQQTTKIYHIGYLSMGTAAPRLQGTFQQGLRDLGWIEGQNYVIAIGLQRVDTTRFRALQTNWSA